MQRRPHSPLRIAVAALAMVTLGAACSEDKGGSSSNASSTTGSGSPTSNLSGTVAADGSSTVAPMAETAAADFMTQNNGVQITVGTSGTGGGFEKFCAGETDMNDASRTIKDEEKAACDNKGVKYAELQVANDGIAVVVNPGNDWVDCLTVDQLEAIWGPGAEGKVTKWSQVDPSFPDEPIELFGPGTDSGTFDYFTSAIVGEEGSSRADYTATEDDNVTVTGVNGAKGGLGYFGLSYALENSDKVRVVKIDGGGGCVEPTSATVQSGDYTPLSRPLYIYPSAELLGRPEGLAFVRYFIESSASIAEEALFVPMTDEQRNASRDLAESLGKQ